MKGVILAGGLGSRLYPLTKITNKHLLPVYHKPMVYFPVELLADAGIKDLMIVCGGNHAGEFMRLLCNGKDFGLNYLTYCYQESEGGIAHALSLTREFVDGDKVVVVLGDNILEKGLHSYLTRFLAQEKGARILLKEVQNPSDYGVVGFDKNKITKIVEKPGVPPSKYAVTGIYFYDSLVFDFIESLKPSERGELEITDVNNAYLQRGLLEYDILDGWWADAGSSIENYYRTICKVREKHLRDNPAD
ncbi:NTP transferase domain-containing protein [bacterium]|nr:NTP transferase domain-containing protein [bacterium]